MEGTYVTRFAYSSSLQLFVLLRTQQDRMLFPRSPTLRTATMRPTPTSVSRSHIGCRMGGNSRNLPKQRQAIKATRRFCLGQNGTLPPRLPNRFNWMCSRRRRSNIRTWNDSQSCLRCHLFMWILQTTKSRETHILSRLQAEAFSEAICVAVTKRFRCLRLCIGVTLWSHRHPQIRRKTQKMRHALRVLSFGEDKRTAECFDSTN